jgi:hypothetical protein
MKENCLWEEKGHCLFDRGCEEKNCDWADLEFSKEAIEKRIWKEKKKIMYLMVTAKDRKRKEINDKSIGIYKMYEILEKEFNVENPLLKEMKNEDTMRKVMALIRKDDNSKTKL